ncbi:unnamed protein product [Paramecium pentaurelia]|uniref:HTH myb-type domain-containing protein n=1 Tax=Paramecium pentaurelia TaxID=43138 RepID=A0A8S1RVS6_9CILI|nr:unnamed protein product [Paramecium pentaurelia]
MLTQVREVTITKRTSKAFKTKKDLGLGGQKNEILQLDFHHPVNTNSEIFVYDHKYFTPSNDQPNYVCDITENEDSVYSQQFMMDQDNQINQTPQQEKIKLIRYSTKKNKENKKRKYKNRTKTFSKEEDQRLLNYILKKGPKFHKFSRYFPGKTTNMLKNRYYKQLRFVWDDILGIQYHHLNFISKEQTSRTEKSIDQINIEEIEELQLFPEVEGVLFKFLDCLSTTFNNIHTNFI